VTALLPWRPPLRDRGRNHGSQEHDKCDQRDRLGDFGSRRGYAFEAECSGDQNNEEKESGPKPHGLLCLLCSQ
jgi:hypothetical protein